MCAYRASYKPSKLVAKQSCHGQTLTNECSISDFPTLKACNWPYMQYFFKRFFVSHYSKVIFSFLIKMSRQKATEIAFFHSLENPKGHALDHFFYASHVHHNFPNKQQTDTYIDELVEILLKL